MAYNGRPYQEHSPNLSRTYLRTCGVRWAYASFCCKSSAHRNFTANLHPCINFIGVHRAYGYCSPSSNKLSHVILKAYTSKSLILTNRCLAPTLKHCRRAPGVRLLQLIWPHDLTCDFAGAHWQNFEYCKIAGYACKTRLS